MIYSSASGNSPFEDIVTYFIKQRKQEDFGAPATKKAEEIQLAKQAAFKQGIAAGLAALATEGRRDLYRKLPEIDERSWLVPAVLESDFWKFLRDLEDAWELGEYKDMSDEEMFAILRAKYQELVFNKDFNERYEHDRRSCILAGLLEPEANDAEWLEAEINQFKNVTAPAEAALAKLAKS